MSKKVQQKEKPGFLCLVYGGCMKLGFVRYFATENTPEEEFEKYKSHYGSDIKGRYIKVSNPSDAYTKLQAELAKLNVANTFGDIYETGVTAAVKVMKEVTGVKKSSTWGMDGEDDVDGEAAKTTDKADKSNESEKAAPKPKPKPKTTAKVTVKGKKPKVEEEAQEIDHEEDEDGENDGEPSDNEPEKKETTPATKQQSSAKKTQPVKKPSTTKKPAPKKGN